MDAQNATQLPNWPLARFATDATLDKIVRVLQVEHKIIAEFGQHIVPDKEGRERYFAHPVDAKVQRAWIARRVVRPVVERVDGVVPRTRDRRALSCRVLPRPHRRVRAGGQMTMVTTSERIIAEA